MTLRIVGAANMCNILHVEIKNATNTYVALSFREILRAETSKSRRGIHKGTMPCRRNIPQAGDDSPFTTKHTRTGGTVSEEIKNFLRRKWAVIVN
ncbi:hypothetical protein HUJ04_007779 [Dendroctonus ponderosae]|nr:hypothetical protein HUJ04_007779 [Dendroctonus ponderosae]